MLTHVSDLSIAGNVNPSREGICWFKDVKDLCGLASDLYSGWESAAGGQVITTDLPGKASDHIASRNALRDWLFSYIKDKPVLVEKKPEAGRIIVNMPSIEKAWNMMFLNEKSKPLSPKVRQCTAHRRIGVALIITNAARVQEGLDPWLMVPTEHKPGLTEAQVLHEAALENLGKDAGVKRLSQADMIFIARESFWLNGREADLEAMKFARGTAQKLYAICKIDNRFPEEKIIDRIIKGEIDLVLIDQKMVKRPEIRDNGTLEECVAVIAGKVKAEKPKTASGADIMEYSTRCPVKIIAHAAKAISMNNIGDLRQYHAKHEIINACIDAIMSGKNVLIEEPVQNSAS